ncbi:MAG: redoxin domain-containing protein [Planctomycetota bacterium]
MSERKINLWVICALFGLLGSVWATDPAQAASRHAIGDEINFVMRTTKNERFTAKDLEGKLVVIGFWDTTDPCVDMMPLLKDLDELYRAEGLVMVSVSVDPDAAATEQVISDQAIDWVVVMDKDQDKQPKREFFTGSYGVPHTFLMSPEGTLIWEGHPANLEIEVEEALLDFPPDPDAEFVLRGIMPKQDPIVTAQAAARAAFKHDFREFFLQAEMLTADSYGLSEVKASGRQVGRYVKRFNAEQKENYELYRSTYPEVAASIEAWVAASELSISDADDGGANVNPKLVASRFRQAEKAEARGDEVKAYELYRWIVDRAPNSDEAMLAQDVVMILEDDPDFMAKYKAAETEDQAAKLMSMARNFAAAEMKEKAEDAYRKVIEQFPDTEAAKEAARLLGS